MSRSEPISETQRPGEPPLRFHVVGEISYAASYVMANWPNEARRPVFDTSSNPMTITFVFCSESVRDLHETLSRAIETGGALARSSRAFRMLIQSRLAGRVIPERPEGQHTARGA